MIVRTSMFSRSIRRALVAAVAVPVFSIAALAGSDPVNPTTTDSLGPRAVAGIELSNFGVMSGRIYRGEQPGKRDFAALKNLGVTTVIDLRLDAKSSSRGLAEAAGLRYVNIGIDDGKQPTDADVKLFLKVLNDTKNEKVYVHCAGGRHRTGSMLAVYRMVHDGWTIEQAYHEMLAYDFYTRNGHKGFKTFVYDYYDRMQADPSGVPASNAAMRVAEAASAIPY